jgi:nicotinamidase-related amidase
VGAGRHRAPTAGHRGAPPFRKDTALTSATVSATPTRNQALFLPLRRQRLGERAGYRVWLPEEQRVEWLPGTLALIVCDVWLRHECRGAEERMARLLPRMDELIGSLRDAGVLIVHAPSGTIPVYEGQPARERVLAVPAVEPPPDLAHDDPPLPVDNADACDTVPDHDHPKHERGMPYPHTRQHDAITIDQERDVVSADGRELYSYFRHRGIEHVLEMGVHTNMCILNRTFSIKQMVRWGVDIALVRDLTDAMYNPARPPYVSHEEGTRLVVEFIEKFWCPTVTSDQVLAAVRRGGGS